MQPEQCPCHSAKIFSKCCQPFLSTAANPRTVTQLMRSRYSAYALGGYGDYLFNTWHPASRGALQPKDLELRTVNWTKLEVLRAEQSGNAGSVEFIAHFTQEDGSAGVHHELSTFVREKGHWLYHQGHEIEES
tara:strand:+ start:446 stop:844 length:399 start_codon:yes stop_codon:yes gene_type:complete